MAITSGPYRGSTRGRDNPETVSTDYNTSERLYFEPLTLEHTLEILRVEQQNGTLHW